jgi:hypothetical protein
MEKCTIDNHNEQFSAEEKQVVKMHPETIDILFKHKEEIHRKLVDLKGTFLLDHIAIYIIDPDERLVIFSLTPSVEYNLLCQNIWQSDKAFDSKFQIEKNFYLWEEAYSPENFNELKALKELKHGFTLGFNLSKKIDDFTLIYAYATRSQNKELLEYYHSHTKELFCLGDYGFKVLSNIYSQYCKKHQIPKINSNDQPKTKPYLKLIVNN